MAAVQFYHLLTVPLERALPKLLEKALGAGYRLRVVAGSDESAEHLNQWLWTYDTNTFLPHGTPAEGNAEKHPILLSTTFDAPNKASIAAITNGAMPERPEAFERILDMFDGNDPQAVEAARNRWKLYKEQGHSISYMKQTQSGGWEQKAVA